MEKMTIKEEVTSDKINISLENIPRCLDCNLICSLKLCYKEGKPIINYYCENNHNGEICLEEYINKKMIIFIVVNVISFYALDAYQIIQIMINIILLISKDMILFARIILILFHFIV